MTLARFIPILFYVLRKLQTVKSNKIYNVLFYKPLSLFPLNLQRILLTSGWKTLSILSSVIHWRDR